MLQSKIEQKTRKLQRKLLCPISCITLAWYYAWSYMVLWNGPLVNKVRLGFFFCEHRTKVSQLYLIRICISIDYNLPVNLTKICKEVVLQWSLPRNCLQTTSTTSNSMWICLQFIKKLQSYLPRILPTIEVLSSATCKFHVKIADRDSWKFFCS